MSDSPETGSQQLSSHEALEVLREGEFELAGLLPWGSNYTFLAYVSANGVTLPAVYKPTRGERPLWDFPTGTLALRELAAYLVSNRIGWGFVPPTVLRDGPHGPGSVQFYLDVDSETHYFTLPEETREQLRPMVLFDAFANNADRKSGHVLQDSQDKLWGIDHGLCFNEEYKLRTVMWDFAEQSIDVALAEAMRAFVAEIEPDTSLYAQLAELLSPGEIGAMCGRINRLLERGVFPLPGPGRNYPWPPV